MAPIPVPVDKQKHWTALAASVLIIIVFLAHIHRWKQTNKQKLITTATLARLSQPRLYCPSRLVQTVNLLHLQKYTAHSFILFRSNTSQWCRSGVGGKSSREKVTKVEKMRGTYSRKECGHLVANPLHCYQFPAVPTRWSVSVTLRLILGGHLASHWINPDVRYDGFL